MIESELKRRLEKAENALHTLGYEEFGFGWGIVVASPSVDANVESVREKLRTRAEHGLKKYGVTTERTDLTCKQWLTHAQEEALDLAVYLQRLINDEP